MVMVVIITMIIGKIMAVMNEDLCYTGRHCCAELGLSFRTAFLRPCLVSGVLCSAHFDSFENKSSLLVYVCSVYSLWCQGDCLHYCSSLFFVSSVR